MWKSEKNKEKQSKIINKKESVKGSFFVVANCYNGGRIVEYCKKQGGKIENFSCENGVVEFCVYCISKGETNKILKKCGGENIKITDIGKVAKLKKHLPTIIGIAVFCLCIAISNLFVFKVETRGENPVTKVHIQNLASEIFPFASVKSEEKLERLKSQLSNCEDIAFYNIEVCQNTVIINFLQSENAVVIPKNQNVIAPESGILISISTLSGTPQKTAGEQVCKGDILISSVENSEFATAKGSGVIKVDKSETFTLPISISQSERTGEIERNVYLKIGNQHLFKGETKFLDYIVSTKTLKSPFSSVKIITETREECDKNIEIKTKEELEKIAVEIFKSKFSPTFAYNISEIKTQSEWVGESCKIMVSCEYMVEFEL